MNKKPVAFFALAVIFLALVAMRLPEGIRAVDVVSLLGTGAMIGALVTAGVTQLRNPS